MRIFQIFLLIGLGANLLAQFIPAQSQELPDGIYNKYKCNLDTAYMNNDSFEVAIQLANLLVNSDTVFNYLNAGIHQNTKNCDRIFNFYNVLKVGGFRVNLVKLDTSKFFNSFSLCEDLLGESAYSNYLEKKQREYQEKLSRRVKLDTTLFDKELINQLDLILKDDQTLRFKLIDKISKEDSDLLWIEQNALDSMNLVKVEEILKIHGYPSKELVGYDHTFTILLVLHHQANLEVRMKYMPILEQALEDKKITPGGMNMYKWRNENIMLSKE